MSNLEQVAQINSYAVPEPRPNLDTLKTSRSVNEKGTFPQWYDIPEEERTLYTEEELALVDKKRRAIDAATREESDILMRSMKDAFETARKVRDPLGRLIFTLGYGHIETEDTNRRTFMESLITNVTNYYLDETNPFPHSDNFFSEVQDHFLKKGADIMQELNREDANPVIWENILFDMLIEHWIYYTHYEFLNNNKGQAVHPFDHIVTIPLDNKRAVAGFLDDMAKKSDRVHLSAFDSWESLCNTFRTILKSPGEFASIVDFIRSKDVKYVRGASAGFQDFGNVNTIKIAPPPKRNLSQSLEINLNPSPEKLARYIYL